MQSSIYSDIYDCSFDPAPMLAAYLITLTRLEEWAAQRLEQGATPVPSPAQV